MVNLSISLPNDIAQASNKIAKKLGISRTEFIRQAVTHELKNVQSRLEQNKIIQCFNSMKSSNTYIEESEEIISELDINISDEQEGWWNNK